MRLGVVTRADDPGVEPVRQMARQIGEVLACSWCYLPACGAAKELRSRAIVAA